MSETRKTALLGTLEHRPRWGLTWVGWAFLLGAVFVAAVAILFGIHPFLAINRPVNPDILVIEGWIPEYAVLQCVPAIKSGAYRRVITVGGPVAGVPAPAADDDTYAYIAFQTLTKAGVQAEMVPVKSTTRDRTFHSATTVRQWLSEKKISTSSINVVTLGVHARRSRLLFEKALGKYGSSVGIIAIRNAEYEPSRWWRYSEGVKEVIAESASYIYARFLFRAKSE